MRVPLCNPENIVRDVPRGPVIGNVEAVSARWWKGRCLDEQHDPVSADTRPAAAHALRRHVRRDHWGAR